MSSSKHRQRAKEKATYPGVAELTGVGKDCTSPVDLSQLALESGEAQAHLGRLVVRERLDRALVDGSGGGEAKVCGGLGDVEGEHLATARVSEIEGQIKAAKKKTHLHAIGVLHGGRRAVVDRHRSLGQAMLLLKLTVEEEDGLGELGRAVLEGLLEQIPCSLKLVATLEAWGQNGSKETAE